MKYIDAELLREKIAEQMESLPREVGRGAGTITSKGYGMMQAFQIMRSIIDSLQEEQPEVDLEKEIDTFFEGWTNSPDYFQAINAEGECVSTDEITDIARHFFTLGVNARKV